MNFECEICGHMSASRAAHAAHLCAAHTVDTLLAARKGRPRSFSTDQAQKLRKAGLTYALIGQRLGVTAAAIHNRLRGKKS